VFSFREDNGIVTMPLYEYDCGWSVAELDEAVAASDKGKEKMKYDPKPFPPWYRRCGDVGQARYSPAAEGKPGSCPTKMFFGQRSSGEHPTSGALRRCQGHGALR